MLGSKEQRTEGMRRQAQELIDQAYERGFNAGKESEAIVIQDGIYQRGLDDAWECARKIMRMGSAKQEDIFCCHGDLEILEKLLPSEAIFKIKAYEEQKKAEEEIRVGDEVYLVDSNHPRVVTCIFTENGCYTKAVQVTESGKWVVDEIRNLHKTGRSFPQIAEVLKQLLEGEE